MNGLGIATRHNGEVTAAELADLEVDGTGAVEVEGGPTEALLGPTAAPGTEAQALRLPRLARHSITLDDGHEVSVAVCGKGIPLVLVHGFSAEGMLYAQSLWRLVDMGFKVVAIDTAGHGGTQGLPTGGADFAAYAALLGRVLDTLGIERAVFAGHSMGGRLVTQYAAADPERVLGVLLIDAIVGQTWDRVVWASRLCPPLLAGVAGILVLDTLSTVPLFRDLGQTAKLLRLRRAHRSSATCGGRGGWSARPSRSSAALAAGRCSTPSGQPHPALRRPRRPRHRRAPPHRPRRGPPGRRRAGRGRGRHPLVAPQGPRGDAGDRARADAGPPRHRPAAGQGPGRPRRRALRPTRSRPAGWFYEPGSLVVALTPQQEWHDDDTLHRAPRYRWHLEAE